VAGALLGAYHGIQGIPERWRRQVWAGEDILKIAEKLTDKALDRRKPLSLVQPAESSAQGKSRSGGKRFGLPGLPRLETFFQEQVIDIVENPHCYRRMGIAFPSGIILHGAPGTGKTFAVEALVHYLKWPHFDITSESIGDKYIHETSRKIGALFKEAVHKTPSLVVIDEMESFLGRREDENMCRVEEMGEFLRQIPRAAEKGVLVIGITNLIEQIDPAFLRRGRFDHIIRVDMPTAEEVEAVLSDLLGLRPCAPGLTFQSYARKLAGRPLSDASFFIREAARLAAGAGKDKIDDLCLARAIKAALSKDEISLRKNSRGVNE